MKKRSSVILLFVVLSIRCSYGQTEAWQTATKEEIINAYQNASNWLVNTPSYFFRLRYTSFSDHLSKAPVESSEAYYKRVTESYRTEALGIKTIQSPKVKFVIDTANRTITAMSPSTYSVGFTNSEELNTMMNHFKALKKIKTSKTTTCYRIEFNESALYDAYEFSISNKGLLERLTFYYSQRDHNGEKIEPRLEIVFYDYQVPAKYTQAEFEDPQITVNETGKVNLKGSYSDYRLLDYRLKK